MRHPIAIASLILVAHALTGCDPKETTVSAKKDAPPESREESAPMRRAAGRDLIAYAPATDFTGASPEDASGRASAMFDGALMRTAVSANEGVAGPAPSGGLGKRVAYTSAASERITDLRGVVPPPPEYPDASSGAASPDPANEAGQTLLGFAAFQIEQKFPTVAPIMSRLGWHAAPRRGVNTAQQPYRVTVHHTTGPQILGEAETARAVLGIQHQHMGGRIKDGKENFDDIGYHFLIAGDGRVVEGRHPEYLGAHARGANDGNIGIAMMGNFNEIKPTVAQLESLTRLVTYLSIKYKKDPAAKGFLEAHQHYTNTECPGKNLISVLDNLRRTIDQENEVVANGGSLGGLANFMPLAVLGYPGT